MPFSIDSPRAQAEVRVITSKEHCLKFDGPLNRFMGNRIMEPEKEQFNVRGPTGVATVITG